MALSINKLEKILVENNLHPKKYFIMERRCIFIEIIILRTADIFMLYIPSKYDIRIDGGDNLFELDYIDVSDDGNIEIKEDKHNDLYEPLTIDTDFNTDINNALISEYNKPLQLFKNDLQDLQDIFNQLKRLKICFANIKYKLTITYKNYLCCLRRDDTFEGYKIESEQTDSYAKKFIITIDLESLYKKIGSISSDIKEVREGIYDMMRKINNKHEKSLYKIIQTRDRFFSYTEKIMIRKDKILDVLENLNKLLEKVIRAEDKNILEYKEVRKNSGNTHDIEMRIEKLNMVKQELIKNILESKVRYENMIITLDNTFFNNIVMFDSIARNIEFIEKINF